MGIDLHGPSNLRKVYPGGAGLTDCFDTQVIDRLGLPTLRMWNLSLIVTDMHKNYHRPDSGGECITIPCDCSHACRLVS